MAISGTSGRSGTSGTSGKSTTSGTSGLSGKSGSSGNNGISGTSGKSGSSGNDGVSSKTSNNLYYDFPNESLILPNIIIAGLNVSYTGSSTNFRNVVVNSNGKLLSTLGLNMSTQKFPTSSTSIGNAGDICYDSNYIYVCISINTWKRSLLSTW